MGRFPFQHSDSSTSRADTISQPDVPQRYRLHPFQMSTIDDKKGTGDGKKRAVEHGGGIDQSRRLAPALRKNGQNAETTSENTESDRLLALKDEERSIRKEFNEQMKAMQEGFEKKIAEKRREIEEARAAIRSKGNIETDSLLFIGADLISKVLLYLQPLSMTQLELVCKSFRSASTSCWLEMDSNVSERDRLDLQCKKTRAIYYWVASKFAEKKAKYLSHTYFFEVEALRSEGYFRRLLKSEQLRGEVADFHLFVRFDRMTDYTLLAQGFTRPYYDNSKNDLCIALDSFDFTRWPVMKSLLKSDEGNDDRQSIDEQLMRDVFRDVCIVVVALLKRSGDSGIMTALHPKTVFMANDFGNNDDIEPDEFSDDDSVSLHFLHLRHQPSLRNLRPKYQSGSRINRLQRRQ